MLTVGCHRPAHQQHAFGNFYGRDREGLTLLSRRGMLKAGLAGIAGLSLPELLRVRAQAAESGITGKSRKSVILLWMAGGPSHIDTLDLSYHTASGTWDTHGDNIPPYGGIKNGLGPLLPLFDHLITTLVSDLSERGLLDETLVLAMGEFGRTPNMGTQDSIDGRNHWPSIMSLSLAGGGLRHGQVIGASEPDGGTVKERPVTPQDLAATIYRHMDVPLDSVYYDHRGRPRLIVENNGQPVRELF